MAPLLTPSKLSQVPSNLSKTKAGVPVASLRQIREAGSTVASAAAASATDLGSFGPTLRSRLAGAGAEELALQRSARADASAGPTHVQEVDVPRFFLHQQNLDSPIHLKLSLELPEGRTVPARAVERFAHQIAVGYPDKQAWWELMNNDLVAQVLQKYPQVKSVKSAWQVGASDQIPMLRTSVVEQRQHEGPREGFEFVLPRVQLAARPGQVFDLGVQFDYHPHLEASEYPDYRPITDFAVAFLEKNTRPDESLESALRQLEPALREAFPALASASAQLKHVRDVAQFLPQAA